MKKATVLALAALCTSAWAAPALAGEFSYGGYMRFRYVTGNPGTAIAIFDDAATGTPDKTASYAEYRIRQYFNFDVNEHVSTNVKFEWNSFFGDQTGPLGGANGDLQVPGETELRIKNAYVRFDVPGAPLTLTVGQQDFSTPKAIISVEDSTGVKASLKALGTTTDIFWARFGNTNDDFQVAQDHGDWYGIVPSFQFGGINGSLHLSYFDVGDAVRTGAGLVHPLAGSEVFFVGVDTAGEVGPLGFTADLVVQTGDVGAGAAFCTPSGGDNTCDLFSFILDVSGTLDVGPGALTLKALYSPGDDNAGDGDADSWVNVVATDLGWSPLFHDGTSIFDFAGSVTPGLANGGIMAAGAEFALSPVRNLTVTPNVYYLMAAEDVNVAGGQPDDLYGIEAGVQANWRIFDAVSFLAQFDYLFAGDVFEDADGNSEDVWRVVLGPSLSW